jgi:hypothetical protein
MGDRFRGRCSLRMGLEHMSVNGSMKGKYTLTSMFNRPRINRDLPGAILRYYPSHPAPKSVRVSHDIAPSKLAGMEHLCIAWSRYVAWGKQLVHGVSVGGAGIGHLEC